MAGRRIALRRLLLWGTYVIGNVALRTMRLVVRTRSSGYVAVIASGEDPRQQVVP
jgi:hypothetical protein